MASTITSTAAASTGPLRRVHAGVNAVSASVTAGTSMTAAATTTFLLAKVPHGATIHGVFGGISGGAATMPFDVGLSYDGSLAASAIATGGSNAADTLLIKGPVQVSCSDDAAVQYKTVAVTVTPGTITTTASVQMTVLYSFDNP